MIGYRNSTICLKSTYPGFLFIVRYILSGSETFFRIFIRVRLWFLYDSCL